MTLQYAKRKTSLVLQGPPLLFPNLLQQYEIITSDTILNLLEPFVEAILAELFSIVITSLYQLIT